MSEAVHDIAIPNGLLEDELRLEGIALTSAAFAHHISWSPYIIAVAALLFAFSTTIAWSYYGLKGWTYIFGEAHATQMIFKLGFCGLANPTMLNPKSVDIQSLPLDKSF